MNFSAFPGLKISGFMHMLFAYTVYEATFCKSSADTLLRADVPVSIQHK